ncbi:hypothetical protein L6164_026201 [Bauhinia variegata]|uniref:Uncharacterized protein n=1 Tax=Bauhinia variegata TaxID=167791 RepID=A0ACB9LQY7_BAUVA|nr:hypothetical protein L6164_026201 [Bauhinia variegata]
MHLKNGNNVSGIPFFNGPQDDSKMKEMQWQARAWTQIKLKLISLYTNILKFAGLNPDQKEKAYSKHDPQRKILIDSNKSCADKINVPADHFLSIAACVLSSRPEQRLRRKY